LFARERHFGLRDCTIVNEFRLGSKHSSELVRVLRFPYAQALRRRASTPAAGVVVALAAAAAIAVDLGGPREALAAPRWNGVAGSVAPLKWLRQSSRHFQRLMHMLAERSARWQGPPASRPPYPASEKWEPPEGPVVGPPEAPHGRQEPREAEDVPALPAPPPPPREAFDAEPRQPWKRGGEAKAGPDRTTAVRAQVWRPYPRPRAPHCRRAGVPVQGAGWYVVGPGDTLWSIAEAHYGNGRAYRRIYRANWRTVLDPDAICACQRLYIPRRGAAWPPFDDRLGGGR
jgi:nucleoid-associated protein YgaU